MDGLYLLLILMPIVSSLIGGDFMRKKIVHQLLLSDGFWSQNLSAFIGVSAQILIIITGVLVSYFLTIFI